MKHVPFTYLMLTNDEFHKCTNRHVYDIRQYFLKAPTILAGRINLPFAS